MLIDGRDLASDGWTLINITEWLSGPRQQRGSVAIPGVAGVIPATRATVSDRTITTVYRSYPATLADRPGLLRTLEDRTAGLRTLRTPDWPERFVRAIASLPSVAAVVSQAAFAVSAIDATITFTAYDGASYDVEPRVLVIGTTPTALSLGTFPSHGILQLTGAWSSGTSRTITLRNAGGVPVATLVLTAPTGLSLTSSEVLELDWTRRYITHITAAGVRTNAYSWKSGGTWFVFDPAHSDRANGRDATLETSAGGAVLFYRKAYAL